MGGPEVINERMCATQVIYSGLFARFAWRVQPRNYLLLSCHVTNMFAQSNQLARWANYQWEGDASGQQNLRNFGFTAVGVLGVIGALIAGSRPLQRIMTASTNITCKTLARHPAGPFFIHFWAPNFKWMLSVNNLLDYNRPTEKISLSMTSALTVTGALFIRDHTGELQPFCRECCPRQFFRVSSRPESE